MITGTNTWYLKYSKLHMGIQTYKCKQSMTITICMILKQSWLTPDKEGTFWLNLVPQWWTSLWLFGLRNLSITLLFPLPLQRSIGGQNRMIHIWQCNCILLLGIKCQMGRYWSSTLSQFSVCPLLLRASLNNFVISAQLPNFLKFSQREPLGFCLLSSAIQVRYAEPKEPVSCVYGLWWVWAWEWKVLVSARTLILSDCIIKPGKCNWTCHTFS